MGCKKNGLQKCAPAIHFSTPHKKQGIRLPSIFCAPFLRKAFFCGPFFLPKYPKFLHGIHDPASQNVTIYQKSTMHPIFCYNLPKNVPIYPKTPNVSHISLQSTRLFSIFLVCKKMVCNVGNGMACLKWDARTPRLLH